MKDTENSNNSGIAVLDNNGTEYNESVRHVKPINDSNEKDNKEINTIGKDKDSIAKTCADRSNNRLSTGDKNSKEQNKGWGNIKLHLAKDVEYIPECSLYDFYCWTLHYL